ncbi:hypothetical protein [Streptomyces sp. NPDC058644]|uniref:hypothetical protein n=1 Tax=unclassified Streptomyces TaxID=2593676 RepID=UPI00365556BC
MNHLLGNQFWQTVRHAIDSTPRTVRLIIVLAAVGTIAFGFGLPISAMAFGLRLV